MTNINKYYSAHAPWVVTMVTDVIVKWFKKVHEIVINPFIDE